MVKISFNAVKGLVTKELARQAFGSPGGKSKIVKRILPTIPPHKIYVEPFAGGAAVFWNKENAEVSVLNDLDGEIAHAYKFIRDISQEQINKLKAMDWTDNKKKFFFMKDKFKPKSDEEKFYRFIYTIRASYGLARKTYGFKKITKQYMWKYLDKLPKLAERLKGVRVFSTNYMNIIKKFDSPDTFFFIDPPYPEEWGFKTAAFGEKQYQDMHELLKSLKGKFCLTTNIRPWITKMFGDFNLRKVLVPRTFAHNDKPDYEWFIYNFDYKTLAETGSNDIRGSPIEGGEKHGLQPSWIAGKKKKKKLEDDKELGVVQRGDRWCVVHGHPKKPCSKTDKPKGAVIKCFPTKAQAEAMHKAIIISKIKRNSEGKGGLFITMKQLSELIGEILPFKENLNKTNTFIKLMEPYIPQKPIGENFYDLNKLMEVLE